MSTENQSLASTPAPTKLVAPPAVDQHVQTVKVELAGNLNAILAEEQAVAEKFIQRAVVFHKAIEVEEKSTNVKKAYEGCLYILGRRQLQSEVEGKTQGEVFDMLLEKSKLKKSTVYKRIQFSQALIDADVITLKMLIQIEEGEKASPELNVLLDKRIGGKKGIEIQRKLGYIPSVETKKIKLKPGKTLKEQLDAKSAQVEALLAEIKKLLEDKALGSEVKDKAVLESLQTGYSQMETATMKFKSIKFDFLPDLNLPELPH